MAVTLVVVVLLVVAAAAAEDHKEEPDRSMRDPDPVVRLNAPFEAVDMPDEKLIQSYRKHFAIKRSEQVAAADTIFEKPQYHKRFNLVKPLLVCFFSVESNVLFP